MLALVLSLVLVLVLVLSIEEEQPARQAQVEDDSMRKFLRSIELICLIPSISSFLKICYCIVRPELINGRTWEVETIAGLAEL